MSGGSSSGIDNRKYYEVLGVSKDASTRQVKKAYKKAAARHHPDKGGDIKKFDEACKAYNALSDPKKRKIYDRFGEDGLKEDLGVRRLEAYEIFPAYFGCNPFGGTKGGQGQIRDNNLQYTLKVSLEDLYLGTTKKFTFSRNVICSECNGTGSKSGAPLKGGGCGGNGMKVSGLDPGQMVRLNLLKCPKCEGKSVVPETKVLEVFVEMGMKHREKITFNGEANEMPNTITGDVILVIHQQDHPKFKRKNDDLFVEHTIPLSQALCGFQSVLTHLDGRKLLLESNPGEIVKPDTYKAIVDEGMPIYQRPFARGKLYVHFSVEFPDQLSLEELEVLKKVLAPKPMLHMLSEMSLDVYELTTLHDVTMETIQLALAQHEDGDDDAPGAQQ